MSQLIRLTKIFTFEMAHALLGYDGLCSNIHGHSYKLQVTVIGRPRNEADHPKNGMVIDFKDVKRVVKEKIVNVYDHALLLNNRVSQEQKDILSANYEKVIFSDYQPSCELMLIDFVNKLDHQLPDGVELYSLRLYETETSYADWFASDQV